MQVQQAIDMCCRIGGAVADCDCCILKDRVRVRDRDRRQHQRQCQLQVQLERDIHLVYCGSEECQKRRNRKKKDQATLARTSFLGLTWRKKRKNKK